MQKTKSGVRKSSSGQGFCCPHCSDSKFPCVNMEQLMRDGGAAAKPDRGKIEKNMKASPPGCYRPGFSPRLIEPRAAPSAISCCRASGGSLPFIWPEKPYRAGRGHEGKVIVI